MVGRYNNINNIILLMMSCTSSCSALSVTMYAFTKKCTKITRYVTINPTINAFKTFYIFFFLSSFMLADDVWI